MKKKIIIFCSVLLIPIISIIIFTFINQKNSTIVIKTFDNMVVNFGEFNVIESDSHYKIKNKDNLLSDLKRSEYLFKQVDNEKYLFLKDGYYFVFSIESDFLTVENYFGEHYDRNFTFFTEKSIFSGVHATNGYFNDYSLYSELEDNYFDVKDKESLLAFFQTTKNDLYYVEGDTLYIKQFTDIDLGYTLRLELDEKGFMAYERI